MNLSSRSAGASGSSEPQDQTETYSVLAESPSHHRPPTESFMALSNDSHHHDSSAQIDTQSQVDVNEHLAVGPNGNVEARGPTGTLYERLDRNETKHQTVPDHYTTAILTANTALEQQKEPAYKQTLLERGHIEGVPAELALHLLDIHWSRHHFFLISYRTAFYRDMMTHGSYYSPLLLFAILAVSSRYSEKSEVGGGDHSLHSGKDFYDRAKQLLVDDMDKSSIPTATALLLMGNALVSAGQVDKGWLYTGEYLTQIDLSAQTDPSFDTIDSRDGNPNDHEPWPSSRCR